MLAQEEVKNAKKKLFNLFTVNHENQVTEVDEKSEKLYFESSIWPKKIKF